jgi:hypothetical protein
MNTKIFSRSLAFPCTPFLLSSPSIIIPEAGWPSENLLSYPIVVTSCHHGVRFVYSMRYIPFTHLPTMIHAPSNFTVGPYRSVRQSPQSDTLAAS